MDTHLIYYADIGDFLYIIILGVLMLVGVFEKIAKSKRQANLPPPQQEPHEGQEPQNLEDIVRQMMKPQPVKTPKNKTTPEMSVKNYYQPIKVENLDRQFADVIIEEEEEVKLDFNFDIRNAIISNEILNRKY